MNVGNTPQVISELNLPLKAGTNEDTLKVYPAENVMPDMAVTLWEGKPRLLNVHRNDEETHRTGTVQSEREILELTRGTFESRRAVGYQVKEKPEHIRGPRGVRREHSGSPAL